MTGFTEIQYLYFDPFLKFCLNEYGGPVMTGGCPNIDWWSFVPIFMKFDRDITKMKKTFLGCVGCGSVPAPSVVVGTDLIWWGNSAQLFQRSEENLCCSLKLQHTFVRDGGTHLHFFVGWVGGWGWGWGTYIHRWGEGGGGGGALTSDAFTIWYCKLIYGAEGSFGV